MKYIITEDGLLCKGELVHKGDDCVWIVYDLDGSQHYEFDLFIDKEFDNLKDAKKYWHENYSYYKVILHRCDKDILIYTTSDKNEAIEIKRNYSARYKQQGERLSVRRIK